MTDDCKAVVEITSDQGETQLGGLIFGHDAVGSLFGGADDYVGCSLGGAEYDQEFVLDEEVSEMVSKEEAEGATTHVSFFASQCGCPRAGHLGFLGSFRT